jgi:hypothetical protein
MAISRDLLKLVPVGEENAVSGLLLWKQLNMWSPASIKHNLQQMADDGVIERKRVRRGPHETNLYFRSRIEARPAPSHFHRRRDQAESFRKFSS